MTAFADGLYGGYEEKVAVSDDTRFWTEKIVAENGQASAKTWNELLRALTQKKIRKSLSVGR